MWVIQRDFILQVSMCFSVLLDGADIQFFRANHEHPDTMNFSDDDAAKVAFDKIVKGVFDGERLVIL